jgi:hypothetical protein
MNATPCVGSRIKIGCLYARYETYDEDAENIRINEKIAYLKGKETVSIKPELIKET